MERLKQINNLSEIPEIYRNTPIGLLLEYHNLGRKFDQYEKAMLLVGMCMDNRKHLIMPDNFAFIIRSGGANLRYSEFKVSYAIAVGSVAHIVLIGHNNCGMVHLVNRESEFVNGLVETAGWEKARAQEHFMNYAPLFEIGNEIDFILSETNRLRLRYPKVMVAPLYYIVENNRLFLINEH
jgi:carbonic anhydrase